MINKIKLIPEWTSTLIVAAFMLLYLYLRLFFREGIPYFAATDQTFFWQYALRMMHGEHVYRDFFQFTPPGADLYFWLLFWIFGSHVWVAALGALLLGLALFVTCFVLASKFMRHSAALLCSSFFTVFVYGGRLDATHHWFSLIAALSATALILEGVSYAQTFLAGALLAVASFFTQTVGFLAMASLLLCFLWEHACALSWRAVARRQLILIGSFGATWLALNAHFLSDVGWRTLWYLEISYPLHYVDVARGFVLPNFSGENASSLLQQIFLYILLILMYPSVFYRLVARRHEKSPMDMRLIYLSTVGAFLLLGVLPRSNWVRLHAVSMPAVVLFVKFIADLDNRPRRISMAGLSLSVFCLALIQIRATHRQKVLIELPPNGPVAIPLIDADEFHWLEEKTKSRDYVFQTSCPSIYLPLDLRSPVFVETLLPERTPKDFVVRTVMELDQSYVRYIIVSPWLRRASPRGHDDVLQPFWDYMDRHYILLSRFANQDELWESTSPLQK